eukprot:CAMPEP_0117039158 /NCGR_PEP_ID=MMETSP0472-20121206/27509_1 /TAXON_ID=693140 ORGANISM="Tiarina fusus, Strain LIS" /NCGR_SAMPLE_ID=MMETSP0472 /ASSEMBLY_ACC=CAM_ASM_000603 /LENGTH=135 /DNA_ID=CAMNT_0004749589 /DNA_START=27 /DNA_END=434 /DNA_ORIENTATION=-
MSNFHAQAINLARRYSAKNENDLLQEDFFEDASPENSFSEVSEDYCSSFLDNSRMNSSVHVPSECQKFANIRASLLQRRKSNQEDEAVAFAGMDAGAALEARRARAHGALSGAQIRRRMTTQGAKKQAESSSWFF